MRIKLPRATNTVKEIESGAALSPFEIRRPSIDLMFDIFERNKTQVWPREHDVRARGHEVQVISDDGTLPKSFDIRELTKDTGLQFLGRQFDIPVAAGS